MSDQWKPSHAIITIVMLLYVTASLGYAATVIPRWLTYYVSSALFANFRIEDVARRLVLLFL
jgi:hypothetical protein